MGPWGLAVVKSAHTAKKIPNIFLIKFVKKKSKKSQMANEVQLATYDARGMVDQVRVQDKHLHQNQHTHEKFPHSSNTPKLIPR